MHIALFLQDLAVIMMIAGIVTIIFHLLRQPVVLGYIVAGIILGRHTPPYSFIHDEKTIETLAALGVIFLMFSLGLEFSLRKLLRVGAIALVTALAEIVFMTLIGYEIGKFFGWSSVNSFFLGTMLAISSTTIIIKALNDSGLKKDASSRMIFGILIIEDILAVGLLAILSSMAISGSLGMLDVIMTLGNLLTFLVAAFVVGMLIVPKLLTYVASFNSREMLLIAVLALCFGFSLLVIKLGYSVALGAFLIGAMVGECRDIKLIEKLVNPLTNMFSAIFFVSIGLMVDPSIMKKHILAIVVISLAVVIGKILVCSLSVFLAGRDGKTSLRVGMGLAQIGEFSFIIASLGISLKVMSPYLYPVIVAVSVVTTFLTPYLIRHADAFAGLLAKKIPLGISQVFNTYTAWLQSITPLKQAPIQRIIKKNLFQIIINLILVIAIFILGSCLSHGKLLDSLLPEMHIKNAVVWGSSLMIALPFLIAIYLKLRGLGMITAEMALKPDAAGKYNHRLRLALSAMISAAGMLGIILLIVALSASILPPIALMVFILVIVMVFGAVLWHWFVKLHSQFQIALMKTLNKKPK